MDQCLAVSSDVSTTNLDLHYNNNMYSYNNYHNNILIYQERTGCDASATFFYKKHMSCLID